MFYTSSLMSFEAGLLQKLTSLSKGAKAKMVGFGGDFRDVRVSSRLGRIRSPRSEVTATRLYFPLFVQSHSFKALSRSKL